MAADACSIPKWIGEPMVIARIPQLIVGGPALAAIIQAVPTADNSLITQLKEIGLIGWLILVSVLLYKRLNEQEKVMWERLAEKDRRIDEKDKSAAILQEATTKSLTANTEILRDLGRTVEDLKESIDHLSTVRETMADKRR